MNNILVRPHRKHAAVWRSLDAAPIETIIVVAPADEPWQRIIAFEGAKQIRRSSVSLADRACRSFLASARLGRPGLIGPVLTYLRKVVSLPGLPVDFPVRALRSDIVPNEALITQAMAVLMRVGLIGVGGVWEPFPQVRLSDLTATWQVREFIARSEGSAARLYWPPGGNSGVSIGPGYDMKDRSKAQIISDLCAVGVPAPQAAIAADGSKLAGVLAETFAKEHKQTIHLLADQQRALLNRILPRYEQLVSSSLPKSIRARIFAHEFDALVSLAYNIANYDRHDPAAAVRRLDMVAAAAGILTLVGTGKGPDLGLVARRQRERTIFVDGVYPMPPLAKGLTEYQDFPRSAAAIG